MLLRLTFYEESVAAVSQHAKVWGGFKFWNSLTAVGNRHRFIQLKNKVKIGLQLQRPIAHRFTRMTRIDKKKNVLIREQKH